MTTTQPATKPTRFDANTVRQAADGKWRDILARLTIEVPAYAKQHGPCPACGGKDRFRFDDKDGRGSWFCNQCDPHAGDGFALVINVRGCDFPEALRLVAGILGLDASTISARLRPRLQPSRPRADRIAVAFQFELAALDVRIRAERIVEAGKHVPVAVLADEELDRAIAYMAQAYADVERAKVLEGVADDLRARDFSERKARERQPCAA